MSRRNGSNSGRSSRRSSRLRRRRTARSRARKLERIQSPSNAIELELSLGDLEFAVDGEEVEALDLVLRGADVFEVPLPEDLVAAGDVDAEGFDFRRGGGVEKAGDVAFFALEGYAAELGDGVSFFGLKNVLFGWGLGRTGCLSRERMESEISW